MTSPTSPSKNTLQVNIVVENDRAIVRLRGDAGLANTDDLDVALNGLSARRPALVVFDLADLTFISSLGLGILVAFERGISRRGGAVRFAAANQAVTDLLKKCRLDSVLQLHETVSKALEG